jgi:hypothetical protein
MKKLLKLITISAGLSNASCGGQDSKSAADEVRTADLPSNGFVLRIENVSTPETVTNSTGSEFVPLSPGAFAVFSGENPLFISGSAATLGIERIAEDGAELQAAQELARHARAVESGRFQVPVGASERGSLAPGDTYEIRFHGSPGEKITFATMFGISNDLFYGPAGIELYDAAGNPRTGDMTAEVELWDAGTEINEEPGTGPNQPESSPANTGPEEGGVVTPIGAVDDPYTYPAVKAVIRVTLSTLE